ncbi:MAG: PocR ligand-binding domain-containing protein [Sterolibacterium sp.]
MNRIAQFVVVHARLAWILVALAATVVGIGASELARLAGERERLAQLQTEAERRSVELMSQTLNGIMMGAMSILGLSDAEIKSESTNQLAPNSPRIAEMMQSVGNSYGAEGTFVVGEDGIVKSSWDSTGKSSTGLNVKFRPYYLMALQGIENVYAAISLTTGRRAIYFSAPVYAGKTKASAATGAMVIRSGLAKVDNLLKGDTEVALLLSPQGVVFAASQEEWIGKLAGEPTADRIKAIRELKQFGNLFEKQDVAKLPFSIVPGVISYQERRHAVARSAVAWNDPYGDWSLILIEDLTRTVPAADRVWIGASSGAAVLLIGALFLLMLRGHHAQTSAAQQLQMHAQQQQTLAQRKTDLATASMRLQQAKTVAELAQVLLEEAHRLLGVLRGAVYVVDDASTQHLSLAAGYGGPADLPKVLALGEGLLGQCAAEGKAIFLDTPPETYWRITSGLGAAAPRSVVILPIEHNGVVLGAIEVAALRALDENDRSLLDELLPLVALNLEVLRRNRQAEAMAVANQAAERDLQRLANAERFNTLAQGREQRIVELKRLANALALKAGQALPFPGLAAEDASSEDNVPAVGEDSRPEQRKLILEELVDLAELQVLFSNFCEAVGVAAAIIDLDGKVLASSRWQRACTDFHRVNPDSCALCIESDTELALKLKDGSAYTMYKCKNGMTDCASPIVVEGQHLANVFIGQFHLGPPNLVFFAEQARRFGYPEAEYLQAVNEAPVMDEQRLPFILGFLTGFARMVTTMSLAQRRADEAQQRLQRERIAAMSLAEDAEQARRALEGRNREGQP